MCDCGENEEQKLEVAQVSQTTPSNEIEEEPQSALSRRSLIKTVSAGALALGLAAGASSEAKAHDVRGCPEISRLSWDLGPVANFEWQCVHCKCNQQENFVAFWRFKTPIHLDACDQKVIPDGSLFVAALRVVGTTNNCPDGAGGTTPKVIARYEGIFEIFHPTSGSKLVRGDLHGTWGFNTELDATTDRCCAFPHDEGCLRGSLNKLVPIPGTNVARRVPCVLHATLTSRCDVSDKDFCERGPLGWIARVNGTIECRCVTLSNTQPTQELKINQWQATPNPVSSHSPITFQAQGQGVSEIQVSIVSLAGAKVFESARTSGNSFIWTGADHRGEPLANGVYLYEVTAYGRDHQTTRSHLQKLIIQR